MAKTADKVKKIVNKEKKCECKELERMSYTEQEELTDTTKLRILDYFADVYGLDEIAATRAGFFDAGLVSDMIEKHLDLFKEDIVEKADTPIGAFHAKIDKVAIARSTTERKGLRATLIVRVEHYWNNGPDAGKETKREFRDVYPCDCVSELVGDMVNEVNEVLVSEYNKAIGDYNNKLECKGKCGDCKCSK